ncbi:MAG: hypothetical protein JXB62_16770 [Pirellulales bacterium]|nr:hypothetical protein [Pirellulales bacterium]
MRAGVCLLLFLLGVPAWAHAGVREAAEKVKQGIAHYAAGDFAAADKAFREADVARPEDPRIAYDRACSLAAAGETDKAVELFLEASLSPDRALAVRCHYNLGCLTAAEARKRFGDNAEAASAETRQQGLALLTQAVGHYRECLKLEEDHADARHNLEVIRLWIKHMQALWKQRDQQKQRNEMSLLEFLQMIETRQRVLRAASKALTDAPDSPHQRQGLKGAASSQRELAEEIEPLKTKIHDELKPPESRPGAGPPVAGPPVAGPPPPPSGPDAVKAFEILSGLADEAGAAMLSAADSLDEASAADAVPSQAQAVENLDQIYMAVAPFPNMVQRALGVQKDLVDRSAALVESPEGQGNRKPQDPEEQAGETDFGELAWTQRFVARWSEILPAKARQGLKSLESAETAAPGPPPRDDTQQPTADPEAAKQRSEGMKRSMQKAIELAPRVQTLATEAADSLGRQEPDHALPKQEEALKLLKEIADPLPKQDQQQQQCDQPQNQQQDQQKQPSDGDRQQQQEQQAQQPPDLSKQQAEAVLRKARQRQQERREIDKRLRSYLYRPGEVEKDW